MKKFIIFAISSLVIVASSCSKKATDDITPNGQTNTNTNSSAKFKTSFDVSGAQYGNLNFNFIKDGSQLERYAGVLEKDLSGNTLTHVWITDMPKSAKTIDDYMSMVIYTEKPEKGSFNIDYYTKGWDNNAVTLRLGKDSDYDVWVCYKGKVTITEVSKLGEPIAGTFDGEFFQASSQKTISVKNGIFSVEHKDSF